MTKYFPYNENYSDADIENMGNQDAYHNTLQDVSNWPKRRADSYNKGVDKFRKETPVNRRKNTVKKKTRKGNPERITQAWLEKRVTLINSMMGNPETAYTKTAGGLKQNAGHLYIDHAYGGVGLERMSDRGADDVSGGHGPKRELSTFLDGFIACLRLIDRKKRGLNPRTYSKKAAKKVSAFRRKSRAAEKSHRKQKYSIWKVGNGLPRETTGLATSNVFTTKAGAKKYCNEHLNKRGSYAIVSSRLSSVGVNKLLSGKR